jgi:hypothetical protein
VPGDGERLHEVGTAGINHADTHHRLSPYSADGGAARQPGRRPAVTRLTLGDQSWKSVLTLSSSHLSVSARAVFSTCR